MAHDFALLCTIAQRVLSQLLDTDRRARLQDLISKCRKLNEDRVRIAHGVWLIDQQSGSLRHVSRQKLEETAHFKNNPGELARLADSAEDIGTDLVILFREMETE